MSTDKDSTPFVINAYAVVPDEDFIQGTPVSMFVDLDKPAQRMVGPKFAHIPETRGLIWYDDFFDDEDDVVAVFDLDYKQMEIYYASLGWVGFAATSCFLPNLFGCLLLTGFPCFLNKNVRWNTRAQHVAITRDGIRFVYDRRHTCWGLPACDAGKQSKTIPFDKIADCDIVEPAGNTCLCVPNTLHSVHVDTASSGNDYRRHELTLVGLKDPFAFKKLVWAMKRSVASDLYPGLVAPKGDNDSMPLFGTQTAEHVVVADGSNENVTTLLRDIREELRRQNQASHRNTQPSAPVEATEEPFVITNDLS